MKNSKNNKFKKENNNFVWEGKTYKIGTEKYKILMEYLRNEMLYEIDGLIEIGSNPKFHYDEKRIIKDNFYDIGMFQNKYHLNLSKIKLERYKLLSIIKRNGGYMKINHICDYFKSKYDIKFPQIDAIFISPLILNSLVHVNREKQIIYYQDGALEKYKFLLEIDRKFPNYLLKDLKFTF